MNTEMDENMNTEKNTEMTKEAAKHNTIEETVDVVVVGAGHAGCEAAPCMCKTWPGNHCIYRKCGQHCTDALQPECGRKLQGTSGAGGRMHWAEKWGKI